MAKDKFPVTPAIRALRQAQVDFSGHLYAYEERGGTTIAARELAIDEHAAIKTLVLEDEKSQPYLVLMHGDLEVSTKQLARHIGVKTLTPCTPEHAAKHTGYLVGGISPFGTRSSIPVYAENSIFDLPKVYINGGKRGFLVGLNPADVARVLSPTLIEVGIRAEE
jgi:Cys-tRNA(Pro) deacylase